MSAPTPVVRAVTYERDGERCVSCGARRGLQYQHRQAVGMGGSKRRPGYADGVTSCAVCNPEYEGRLQREALLYGWKVARWVSDPSVVPVFYRIERAWFRLTTTGSRVRITEMVAVGMMRDAYGPTYDALALESTTVAGSLVGRDGDTDRGVVPISPATEVARDES